MLGIISLILEASSTDAHDARKTTVMMYNSLLNHPRLKEYWSALTEQGLLVYDDITQTFKTTEKGLRFLNLYNQIKQLMKEQEQQQKQQLI